MLQGLLTSHCEFPLSRLCFFQLSPEHLPEEFSAVHYVIAAEVAQAYMSSRRYDSMEACVSYLRDSLLRSPQLHWTK